jgi:membrane-associated phospholipid phosphatase
MEGRFRTLISVSARADFAGRHALTSIAVILLFTLADLAWAPFSSVHVNAISLLQAILVFALLGSIYLLGLFARHRARGDGSPIAKIVSWGGSYLSALAASSLIFAALSLVGCIFMYFASATARPLMDAYLAAADMKLGFNWPHFVEWVNGYPLLDHAMVEAYRVLGLQVPLLFLLLAMPGRTYRLSEFVALIAVASLVTGALLAAIPAADAYAFFGPPRSLFSNFTGIGGLLQLETLRQLRSGSAFELNVFHTIGIASFPSFHAALGLIILYSLRRNRLLLAVVGIVNVAMFVSTIPEGGHHLIDVIAGAAVAIASIAFVRWIAHASAASLAPVNETARQTT